MAKQMERIVDEHSWVTRARNAIVLDIEYGMGGHSVILFRGSRVNILTRFENEYSGWIDRYEPAKSETDQDGIVVVDDNGVETKIGLQHIAFMDGEVWEHV